MRVQIEMLRKVWKHFKSDFRSALRPLGRMWSLPSGLPDQCEGIVTTAYTLRIGIPLDPPLMREVADIFRADGWEVPDFEVDDYGFWMEATATHPEHASVHLTALRHKEGSTCTLDLIGEEEVTKRVYEVVCNDGSKEKVFV